jgi:hypothetical protein
MAKCYQREVPASTELVLVLTDREAQVLIRILHKVAGSYCYEERTAVCEALRGVVGSGNFGIANGGRLVLEEIGS